MVGPLVQKRREALRLTQTQLAQATKLRQTYISQVERGEIALPRDHNLEALGNVLGLTRADFYRAAGMLEGIESETDSQPAPMPPPAQQPLMPVAIPVYDTPVSAGKGVPALQQYIYLPPDIDIRTDWYGLPVNGECMFPLLLSGDTVIISPSATPESGDMVVVDMEEEKGLVKWYRRKRGEFWLEPEKGDPIKFDEERMRIVGVVMRMWRNVRRPRKGMWSE